MSYIDLDYIGTSRVIKQLSSHLTKKELADLVLDLINDAIELDRSRAQCYLDKYDNKYDLLEGHDVRPLKSEIEYLSTNLKLLTDLIRKE